MLGYYIVKPGGEIVPAKNIIEWTAWMEESDKVGPHGKPFLQGGRRVAWTPFGGGVLRSFRSFLSGRNRKPKGFVSTVFLGVDSFGVFPGSSPVLFETMIFWEDRTGREEYQERRSFYTDALECHKIAVKFAKEQS